MYRYYERWGYAPSHGTGAGGAIYSLIGVVVALAYNYFAHLTTLRGILSAILAILLWPLLLLGVDVRVH